MDSRENAALFDFYGAPAATKMVLKLLKDVCSDLTDKLYYCQLPIVQINNYYIVRYNGSHILSIVVQAGMEWGRKQIFVGVVGMEVKLEVDVWDI